MRRFEFEVDREHAHAVNETFTGLRRMRVLALLAAGLAVAATAAFLWSGQAWGYLLAFVCALAAVIALWVALWTPHRSDIEKLYRDGVLVPAVVCAAEPNGIILLALVDTAEATASARGWALVTRKVRALPGHEPTLGERVPSVAVRTDGAPRQVGERWQLVTAMPIAWGTRDRTVIERARDTISDLEWRLLADNLALAARVRRTATKRLMLDPQHLPPELA
ncbi:MULTISPECIES: DUF3239 domain-containing protein [Nocardia]|uniref:Uncharacterized protein DUF3239 n=2 Tax=Nocardia TaxID=1817 RepID=A0A4R6PNA8_NOCIG|nr:MULTISPECIES: DUF3239 domain-containing protein [Nocardia]NKX88901.1 DUF3239 domain-containing protein [Nocardia coubleae]TDP39578.1 uncharacterized protein DUF3239 [Nocardia ignorata]